jgi:AcrR family transcriptional regulator
MLTLTDAALFAQRASHLGKSARTKARLVDAAIVVFARDGLETASVNEVAREAGVANGTFYLHFKDKDELTNVVAFKVASEIARELDESMVGIDDAVERISRGTREFIRIASARADWGWAFIRAFWSLDALRLEVSRYLRSDLERGVQQGAFTVEVDDFLVGAVGTMVVSALFAHMSSDVGPEVGSKTAELQLRMLGVPPARARRAAWRPL